MLRSANGINLNNIPIKHKRELKERFNELKINHIVIYPLYDEENKRWIDYVFGLIGSKIAIKAFTEPNRVEESTKAMFELEELQNKNKGV